MFKAKVTNTFMFKAKVTNTFKVKNAACYGSSVIGSVKNNAYAMISFGVVDENPYRIIDLCILDRAGLEKLQAQIADILDKQK